MVVSDKDHNPHSYVDSYEVVFLKQLEEGLSKKCIQIKIVTVNILLFLNKS